MVIIEILKSNNMKNDGRHWQLVISLIDSRTVMINNNHQKLISRATNYQLTITTMDWWIIIFKNWLSSSKIIPNVVVNDWCFTKIQFTKVSTLIWRSYQAAALGLGALRMIDHDHRSLIMIDNIREAWLAIVNES